MSITMRTRRGLLPGLCALALFAWTGACGDDSGNGENGNGPAVDGTPVLYSPTDPCDQGDVPRPNQLFTVEELAECPLPSDPVEAAIAGLERGEGADVDTAIELQVDGAVLPESLSSTVTFALDGSGSPTGLPPVVLIRRVVTGTTTTFETVDFVASRDGLRVIRIEPREDLDFGVEHYVIATRAITTETEPPEALAPSPEVEVVVGNAEPADVNIEDPVAARLLAERGRVSDVLALVATQGQPAIAADDIVSIHSFRTKLGPERLVLLAQRYSDAFVAGRIEGDITITDNAVPVGEISPIGPDNRDFSENVESLQRGTITMPRLLDENGRLRDTWDTDGQTIDVAFTLSIPAGGGRFGVAAAFLGFGRGSADIVNLAPENASVGVAVMQVDLRCHGSRSPDPVGVCQEGRSRAEIDGLVDEQPNNFDPRAPGSPDGIPDDSGRFFFSGEPGQLRDTQLAATIEILHVLSVLRFQPEELENAASIEVTDSETGLIAHAQAAPAALAALAMFARFPDNDVPTRNRAFRAMFAGAGVGYEELILDGPLIDPQSPEQIRTDFLATAPEGIDEDNVTSYVRELETRVLEALDPEVVGPEAAALFNRGADSAIVFPLFERDVPVRARDLLDDTLDPDEFVRAADTSCEHFLLFPCSLNEIQPTLNIRGSAANFMSGSSF
jgi:hypothetical protein